MENLETVAVIGCSSSAYRTSNHIAKYIQNQGIRMIPVNPNEESVLGEKSYASIVDIPGEIQIDIVDIFRNKKYTKEMVEEIVSWSQETGQKPVVWTQLDVSTKEAKNLAEQNSLKYVENRCLMVEHRSIKVG